MAAGVVVVINPAGVRALLKDSRVLADLERRAQAIAATAGEGFEVESFIGANRARASVRTATEPARRAEVEDHTLTRAIDAGR